VVSERTISWLFSFFSTRGGIDVCELSVRIMFEKVMGGGGEDCIGGKGCEGRGDA
jgi:hypothetical protein